MSDELRAALVQKILDGADEEYFRLRRTEYPAAALDGDLRFRALVTVLVETFQPKGMP